MQNVCRVRCRSNVNRVLSVSLTVSLSLSTITLQLYTQKYNVHTTRNNWQTDTEQTYSEPRSCLVHTCIHIPVSDTLRCVHSIVLRRSLTRERLNALTITQAHCPERLSIYYAVLTSFRHQSVDVYLQLVN